MVDWDDANVAHIAEHGVKSQYGNSGWIQNDGLWGMPEGFSHPGIP